MMGGEDGRDRPNFDRSQASRTNHGKEPLRAQIVSAMASTIC